MTHPDFGERGFEEELTPEQVAILKINKDMKVHARYFESQIKILQEDIQRLEQQIWTLKNEDKS